MLLSEREYRSRQDTRLEREWELNISFVTMAAPEPVELIDELLQVAFRPTTRIRNLHAAGNERVLRRIPNDLTEVEELPETSSVQDIR